jgi:hypothetical protein
MPDILADYERLGVKRQQHGVKKRRLGVKKW